MICQPKPTTSNSLTEAKYHSRETRYCIRRIHVEGRKAFAMADSPGTRDDLSCLGINVSRNRSCRPNHASFSNGRFEIYRCWIAANRNLSGIETISDQSQANMGKSCYGSLVALGGKWTRIMGSAGNPVGHDYLNFIAQSTSCSTCRLGSPIVFSRSSARHQLQLSSATRRTRKRPRAGVAGSRRAVRDVPHR